MIAALQNQQTISQVKDTSSTQFLSQTTPKLICKLVEVCERKFVGNLAFDTWGGSTEGRLFKILVKKGGAYPRLTKE